MKHLKRSMLTCLLVIISGALAQNTTGSPADDPAFADVPPCHWAADAVNRLAGRNIFLGFPPEDTYLATNALRQVFAGLGCDAPSWSLRFLHDAPADFGEREPRLVSYDLQTSVQELGPERGSIVFTLTVVLEQDGMRRTESREGTATVLRDGEGWRVDYDSLVPLELNLFPPRSQTERLVPLPSAPTMTFRGG
jgi:hypothetical protein